MTRQELIERIISVAHQTVRSRQCTFSVDAERQLREMVTSGVNNTMSDIDLNNPSRVLLAQNNMRDLCNKLCDRVRGENRYLVENRTFSNARMSICPVWPFC